MNIALFTDCYLPSKNGVVTVVSQLKESLEKLGHNVIIVTVKNERHQKSGTKIYRAVSIPVGMGTTDQYFGFVSIHKLVKFLKPRKIDVIHVHTEFTVGNAGIIAARKLHVPLIATSHTAWEEYYQYYLKLAKVIPVGFIRRIMRHFFRKSNAVVAVSDKTAKYLKKDFMIPDTPVFVINNALDPKKFNTSATTPEEKAEFRHKWGIKDDEVLTLFVGRVGEEKHIFELIKSCSAAIKKNTKIKLMIVGDGPALADCKKEAEENGVKDNIIFTGFMDWSLLHTVYSSADTFITASLSEMHPMTVSEAIICKNPIIARYDESLTDRVFHGENGFLAENDEELTTYLLDLAADKEKRIAFSKNSELQIKKCYPDVFVAKHLALYTEAKKAYPGKINSNAVTAEFEKIEKDLL